MVIVAMLLHGIAEIIDRCVSGGDGLQVPLRFDRAHDRGLVGSDSHHRGGSVVFVVAGSWP
jgi:hypothetical protein